MDHMGKMLCIYDAAERNLYITSVYLYINIFPGIRNTGKNLIDQIRKLFYVIRFYKIVQGTDLKALQSMVSRGCSKNQKTIRIRFSKFSGNLHTVCTIHINIQEQNCERPFPGSFQKSFSIFKFSQVSVNTTFRQLFFQPCMQEHPFAVNIIYNRNSHNYFPLYLSVNSIA